MSWLVDPFQEPDLQRALLAGLLAVVTTSTVGTWVVVRGMSFVGDALAHGVLPGIGVAVTVGVDPGLGAFVAAMVTVVLVSVVSRREELGEDASIGLLFVGMLALGVIITSRADQDEHELTEILFGDPLSVTTGDLVFQGAALVVVLVLVAVLHRPLLALSFSETKAALLGLHPRLTHLLLMVMIGLAVVASFQTVGTLMTFGLLVAPPASALLIVRRVWLAMAVATLFGWTAVVAGLLVAHHHDTEPGATMAGLAVAGFFVVLVGRELADWRSVRRVAARPGEELVGG